MLSLSIADSYCVQNIVCQKRVEAGEDVIEYKVGGTSTAIRDQFGVDEPISGQNLPDESLIEAIECVSPGIELHNYTFWHDPPCLQELFCSGGIHAGLIVGKKRYHRVI